MGAVLLAKDRAATDPSRTWVAVKVLRPELASLPDLRARFAREASLGMKFAHPNIVKVLEAGSDPIPYMAMEYLEGESLAERLYLPLATNLEGPASASPVGKKLGADEVLALATGALLGLEAAHEEGIVHRDLKPDNLFLVKPSQDPSSKGATIVQGNDRGWSDLKIMDFGISKPLALPGGTKPLALTKRGALVGTPYYMSPEQAHAADDLDGRSDLFGLAAILYECLTGVRAFWGRSYEQAVVAVCTKDLPPVHALVPSVPLFLSHTISMALARKREERIPSARAMLLLLERSGLSASTRK